MRDLGVGHKMQKNEVGTLIYYLLSLNWKCQSEILKKVPNVKERSNSFKVDVTR